MTQDQKDALITALKARIKMYSHINRSREEIATLTAGDEFERLQLASDRDVLLHHVSQESAMLHDMNDALQRLEDGTYGSCLSCEEEIPPKRLAAIPWVAYCVHCQERIERAGEAAAHEDAFELAA